MTRCALLLLLTASFLATGCSVKKKKKKAKREERKLYFILSFTCLVCCMSPSSVSLQEEDRETKRLQGRVDDGAPLSTVSPTCTLSVSVRHSPPSQFKLDDYIHHVFRRYYPSPPPPPSLPLSLPHCLPPSLTHVHHHPSHHEKGMDGVGLRDRGRTSDDKVLSTS